MLGNGIYSKEGKQERRENAEEFNYQGIEQTNNTNVTKKTNNTKKKNETDYKNRKVEGRVS